MKVVTPLSELRSIRSCLTDPFGLVPTMGYLHEGHLSLVRAARADCASVGVSIFVNPTQFGPREDLGAYPRDLERDLELLRGERVDLVWTPTSEEMYPVGFQTWVTVEHLSAPLEGAHRPGHFRAVATVVAKLLNAFQPRKAYFGQKDAQQARLIRQMVRDLNFPIDIVICPTVRETDGLAMSSRNIHLNPAERQAAAVLYHALMAAARAYQAGERKAEHLKRAMQDILDQQALAKPEYVSVADPDMLQELSGEVDRALLSLAVYIGATRLIDNMLLESRASPAGRRK
jgi:pantoate--beta-alanine ligase